MARSDLLIHFQNWEISYKHLISCLEKLEALILLGLYFLTQFKESFPVTIRLVQIPVILYWVAHLDILIQISYILSPSNNLI